MKLFTKVLLLLFVTTSIYAQKPKVTKGEWSVLTGIKEYNLVFNYEGMDVIDYDSEAAYLEEKVTGKNEKEAGSGDKYKENWFKAREESYKPDFIKGFNKKWEDIAAVSENSDAEYTMEIKTTKVYPGWFVGIATQPVKLYFSVIIYKTDTPSDILFTAIMDKVLSSNSVFVAQYTEFQRISNAYYMGAQYFKKRLKKKAK
jgi:hypothetical protein